jgi:hypothetical protein
MVQSMTTTRAAATSTAFSVFNVSNMSRRTFSPWAIFEQAAMNRGNLLDICILGSEVAGGERSRGGRPYKDTTDGVLWANRSPT